jgi:hypothetical protein
MANGNGSIIMGSVWMVLISILLFWLPVLGPLLAGFVGGKTAGGIGGGIIAVFLPAILMVLLTVFLVPLIPVAGVPVIGAMLVTIFSLGIVFVALQVGLLLVGAIFGGLFA